MGTPLEDETEEILRKLVSLHPEYRYHRQYKIEGASSYWWKTDFILMKKEDILDAVMECKDIGGEEWEERTQYPNRTFETHMCRAYTLLNDIHLKYPKARLYVIIRDLPTSDEFLSK